MKNGMPYLLIVLIVTITFMIPGCTQDNSQELICNNLVEDGLLGGSSNCATSSAPPEYIPILFPVSQVNVDYVTKGMQGIEIIEQTKLAYGCQNQTDYQLISYALRKDILGPSYIVRFKFCDQILDNISFSE